MSDIQLFIGKTKQPFKDIFDMYYKGLCLFTKNFSMDTAQAEDIVQDIFVRICEHKVKFSSNQSLKVYLYQAVKNSAINILRKQEVDKKFKDWTKNKYIDDRFFYHKMIEEESYRLLIKAIDKLPPRSKEVFLLNLEGFKNQEIADLLNLSINTVRTHKAKGLKLLKKDMRNLSPLMLAVLLNFN
jgi:RNA polymerase sigma-70 factor (ECF subfamily)